MINGKPSALQCVTSLISAAAEGGPIASPGTEHKNSFASPCSFDQIRLPLPVPSTDDTYAMHLDVSRPT